MLELYGMEMSKTKKLWTLFMTTFSISATTNGGYAIVAAMRTKFIEKYHWFEEDEMLDLLSIGQSVPGPIAINSSILVGYRVAGIPGALITTFGTVLPPLVIMSVVTVFYEFISTNQIVRLFMKGMASGVAALLVSVTYDLFKGVTKKKEILSYILMVFAFVFTQYTDYSILYLAIICAVAGIIKTELVVKEAKK